MKSAGKVETKVGVELGVCRPALGSQHHLPVHTIMEYIDVHWKHQDNEDPVRLVSEIGEDRFELRKLEFFADGTTDVASGGRETARTRLGLVALPSLEEINQDQQFEGAFISRDEFEALWLKHAHPIAL